jgi:hypothetical protein
MNFLLSPAEEIVFQPIFNIIYKGYAKENETMT